MQDSNIEFPLTIEKQLERYYLNEKRTERHEVLWHTWNQNKRWLTQLLQITLCSYPTYSKHDESHAQSVLHNIEMILGEDKIAELSASDCFILLHTVYLHDIGMCITHQDREEILQNRAFFDMISELEGYEESSLHSAIIALEKKNYEYDEENPVKAAQQLYMDKLEVYYALVQLIGDFRRREHGEKARERLSEWVKKPDYLGSGFSLAGMPQRIFLTIANCARTHTQPDFDAVMDLPQEDDGYVSDYIHPRFVSVLLQLGDILDMDNNRFHPMMQMYMHDIPETAQQHYDKHMSIRKLHIRPDKIEIEADCESQEALRLVRKECDMLKSILKDAGYSWAVICPPGYKGSLPTVESVELYLNGKKIPGELVSTQFKISQQKAFSILEGANVYSGLFVFLREFLQNALDATKMQYWNDCISTSEYYKNKGIRKESPDLLEKYVSTNNYPIEIEMKIQKKDPFGKISDVTEQDIKDMDEEKKTNCVYGVNVRIKDFGTGMDKTSILNISKVGSSRKKDRSIIESMPEWLRPTAEFGIGLQSAFLLVGSFYCYTHTRSGEHYEITFGSGSSLRYDGYINVESVNNDSNMKDKTFGTCFEIFVPTNKKRLHQDCLKAWNGADPFSEEYERRRPLRHAAELIAQMAIYLNGLVGELLFPVHLTILKSEFIAIKIEEEIDNLHLKWDGDKEDTKSAALNNDIRPWIRDKKSWIFYRDYVVNDKTIISEQVGNDIYLLDCKSARLHIWSGDANAFVTISGKSLVNQEKKAPEGFKVYYKGIELQTNQKMDDSDFIEYVDIKGDLDRNLLNLSRKGFTEKGEKHFEDVISPQLQISIENVLKALAQDERITCIAAQIEARNQSIKEELLKGNKSEVEIKKLCMQVVSALVLIYLSNRNVYNLYSEFEFDDSVESCQKKANTFDDLLKNILEKGSNDIYNKREDGLCSELREQSLLFNIRAYNEKIRHSDQKNTISLVDFFAPENKFAILQKRERDGDIWYLYLIRLNDARVTERVMGLVFERNRKQRNSNYRIINQWGEELIKNVRLMENTDEDVRQQFLLKWIIKNIPTIAMLSDGTGNIRINLLSNKILPFIYMNDEFKMLILKRMYQYYKQNHTERFSTIAWQNREFLSCKQLPFSAYFVKRGLMSMRSYNKVIVPLRGGMLKELHEKIEKIGDLPYVKNMYRTLEEINIREYLQSVVAQSDISDDEEFLENDEHQKIICDLRQGMEKENLLQSIYEFFTDVILGEMQNDEVVKPEEEYENLLNPNKKRLEIWHDIYLKLAHVYMQTMSGSDDEFDMASKIFWSIREQAEYKELCSIIYFFGMGIWEERFKKCIADFLFPSEYKDDNRDRMLAYIKNNSQYSLSAESMELCYADFEKEILTLHVISAQEKIKPQMIETIKLWSVMAKEKKEHKGDTTNEQSWK